MTSANTGRGLLPAGLDTVRGFFLCTSGESKRDIDPYGTGIAIDASL